METVAVAAPGDLDPSFGADGIVVIGRAELRWGAATAVAIQPDTKIVIAGGLEGPTLAGGFSPAVVRLNADGSLDEGFGTNGIQVVNADSMDVTSLALQQDGKILVAGTRHEGSDDPASLEGKQLVAVRRFNADGNIDTSFGQNGTVSTGVFRGEARANDVALQADGRIVVVGSVERVRQSRIKQDFAIFRYNTDGALDLSFGRNGKRFTDFFNRADSAAAVAIQADGRIVVAGGADRRGGAEVFALARYRADGSLDTSFGRRGKLLTSIGENADAKDLVIQRNGRIVAVGSAARRFAVARYKKNGRLDPSFSRDGIRLTAFAESDGAFANAAALQPNGRILAAGSMFTINETRFALARLLKDGRLDQGFGDEGKVIVALGEDSEISALAIQQHGKIVAAGSTFNLAGNFFTVLRFLGR